MRLRSPVLGLLALGVACCDGGRDEAAPVTAAPASGSATAAPVAPATAAPPEPGPAPGSAPAVTSDPAPASSPAPREHGSGHSHTEGTLAHYMTKKVKEPMSAGDVAAVRAALEPVPGWVPDPAWNEGPDGWKAIVEAALAPGGNVGRACKRCHDLWQKKYKERFHERKLPR